MSDEEWLLVLLDVLLPIQEMNFKVNDGMGFQKAVHEQALDKILSIRLKIRLRTSLRHYPMRHGINEHKLISDKLFAGNGKSV